ncbi:c-type cytochrome [Limnobacter sp.]|uniref:c-type cytochrome n=1 Tax=Limnobacter sp. TaxID=2003368 RepID=UPI00258EF520|nr:c-type cytochrome [Limnobacter sp.]
MNKILNLCAGLVFAATALLVRATPLELKLPPETAQFKISPLPGYVVATQKCVICHSADYIKYQPPGMNLAQWTSEAGKMQHLYGAPLTDDEIRKVGAYLAVTYGTAQESELPPELKVDTPISKTTTEQVANLDATSLLNANSCLGCHAIDKKIVGPSYHEVAVKYKGDPQALAKIAANIRAGGSGKWGSAAMPPFSQLTSAELRTLAEFVLRQ